MDPGICRQLQFTKEATPAAWVHYPRQRKTESKKDSPATTVSSQQRHATRALYLPHRVKMRQVRTRRPVPSHNRLQPHLVVRRRGNRRSTCSTPRYSMLIRIVDLSPTQSIRSKACYSRPKALVSPDPWSTGRQPALAGLSARAEAHGAEVRSRIGVGTMKRHEISLNPTIEPEANCVNGSHVTI